MYTGVPRNHVQARQPLLPNIKYFLNPCGEKELLRGEYRLGVRDRCVMGVIYDGKLCRIYDEEGELVMVDESDLRNVVRLTEGQVRRVPYGQELPSRRVEVAPYTWRFPMRSTTLIEQ